MSPVRVALIGLILAIAGCARIIIQIGEGHRSDAEVSAATTTEVDVNRKDKEIK